jgi:hypothetical protein
MKRLFLLVGLIMVATISACSGADRKTKIEIKGQTVEVDTFTARHYGENKIYDALQRDEFVKKVSKPKDAKNFGKKLSLTIWKAFTPEDIFDGEVSVVYYEKGVEIVKNGKSWYYDYAHMSYIGEKNLITGTASVLYPGVWEPAVVSFAQGLYSREIEYWYIYDCGYKDRETFYMFDLQQEKLGIKRLSDLIVDYKAF